MTVAVKINGEIFPVPSGAAKDAVYSLMEKKKTQDQVRAYLAEQRENAPFNISLGYVDFDKLTNEGNPTIEGKFYRDNTVFGLKLSGQLEERLKRIRASEKS